MSCVQLSDTDVCNSEGDWITNFNVSLTDCQPSLKNKGTMTCRVGLLLQRGWTPSHGGLKPLNTRMKYEFTVYWLALSSSLTLRQSPNHTLQRRGSILHEPESSKATIITPSTLTIPPSIDFLALNHIGFRLIETNGHPYLGRYVEGMRFFVQNLQHGADYGSYTLDWTAGVWAPSSTTFHSNAEFNVGVSLLQYLDSASSLAPIDSSSSGVYRTISGVVCTDDQYVPYTFKCASKKLPSQTQDRVDIPSISHDSKFVATS